jgi:TolB protein
VDAKRQILIILLIAVLPGAVWARAEIDFFDPNFRPYPMAISDFKDMSSGAKDLVETGQEVLRSDLGIAGVFKLIDPRSFIADPKQEGLSGASINFADWINVGAEGLIKVGVHKSGTDVTLDCHLYDVASGKELLHKKYNGKAKAIRIMVHKFADVVVRHFTGNPSIFFTKIVFAKRVNRTTKEVCIMDFDGRNEHCVVKNGSINLLPAWGAGGRTVYYSSYIKGGPHLYKYDLRNKKNKAVSKASGLNIGASASPNGKSVALTLSKDDNSEVYVLKANGANPKRLTRDWAIDSSPSWSPDSKRIAFVSERSGNPQVYVMNVDGSGAKRLTFKGNYNQTPDWSPRGDWILFNARDERLVYDIFKINPETGVIKRLTQDQGNNEHPTFSPDGSLVVFSSTRTGESKLYVMNADGTNQRLISRNKGEYTTPEWGPWVGGK